MTLAEIDLRVGGAWRYVMIDNGGFEVGFHGEYREIVPNERIVATEVYEGPWPQDGEPAVTTVTFTALDGGRTLLEQLMQSPAGRSATRSSPPEWRPGSTSSSTSSTS